jgi:hypothetical protein
MAHDNEQTPPADAVPVEWGLGAWVPMAERLPPTNTPVLVCAYDGTVTAAKFEHEPAKDFLWWHGAGFGGHEWEWNWDASSARPWRGVTYWMPMPAPQEKR